MADGIPAVARSVNVIGMRRGGIDAASRRQVQAAFRLLYRSGMAPGAAIKRVKQELGGHPLVARLVEFVEGSKRGVIPAGARTGRAPAEAFEEEMS
jgi:UDP-N-acetylglucosamine acyltransferase